MLYGQSMPPHDWLAAKNLRIDRDSFQKMLFSHDSEFQGNALVLCH